MWCIERGRQVANLQPCRPHPPTYDETSHLDTIVQALDEHQNFNDRDELILYVSLDRQHQFCGQQMSAFTPQEVRTNFVQGNLHISCVQAITRKSLLRSSTKRSTNNKNTMNWTYLRTSGSAFSLIVKLADVCWMKRLQSPILI